ncbi:hypothetical protein K1T71_002773 [Dendrolimus kikuchii]|uniref:Uncharacterized protein n=1 Tax=Dendrolimus kikuchii TaxID=765133 RepID=A0ACC1DDW5_9NEOP|nr:hypothetical protein K1T71_002773 [Dendrolimus kikuchii]
MCGIICEISSSDSCVLQDANLLQCIKNRGPDYFNRIDVSTGFGMTVSFFGAVLWMQGTEITKQPVNNDHGVLLYNGDIFEKSWNSSVSDTLIVMKMFSENNKCAEDIVKILNTLKGPFSLVYYNKSTHDLYFARDKIGRTSLLFHKSLNTFVISSVLGREYMCIEVPTTHINIWNLKSNRIKCIPWENTGLKEEFHIDHWWTKLQTQQSLSDDEFHFEYETQCEFIENDPIIDYIDNISRETKCKLTLANRLLDHAVIKETVLKLTSLLENSTEIRLERQQNKCKLCLKIEEKICNHCTVGVLFSGGLDCTVLALLADKFIPPNQSIDLINVAFDRNQISNYNVPDRITGKQSFEELKRLRPNRNWVFKEVNVSKHELEEFQSFIIGDLVYPRKTILDESLGSALWFAARGQDDIESSTCRILLVGSGADELFGGYTRHRNAFRRQGWLGLSIELQLDWKRISFRNLSRDNRVICDHGRQPRMPYLDEDFTQFVLSLQPWLKCFPSDSMGPGIGDKMILRLVAINLGLTGVATLPKRALQFGSRIANKKENGSDISKTFLNLNKIKNI